MRIACILLLLAVLAGCAETHYVKTAPAPMDETFRTATMRWTGTFAGQTTRIYYKAMNRDGRLVLCGAYEDSNEPTLSGLAGAWFNGAEILVDGEPAAPGWAIEAIRGAPEAGRMMPCIVTDRPAVPDPARVRFKLRGHHVYGS
jgi:hypothetical protein